VAGSLNNALHQSYYGGKKLPELVLTGPMPVLRCKDNLTRLQASFYRRPASVPYEKMTARQRGYSMTTRTYRLLFQVLQLLPAGRLGLPCSR
jgi:hypothetical protein